MAEISEKKTTPMKRFYKQVSVGAVEEKDRDGWQVLLDGRVLKTPAQRSLVLPTEALARELAAEWDAQKDQIDAQTMPIMTLACTALDWVVDHRPAAEDTLIDYGSHDLLCYWDHSADQLLELQERVWQPLLDLSASAMGAPLERTSGLLAVDQPAESALALARVIARCSVFQLSALMTLVQEGGSLVVGLLALGKAITEEQVVEAVLLHDQFQLDRWGSDDDAQARIAATKREFEAVFRFLDRGSLLDEDLLK
ncbi:ATP12 family protein [Kiloniella sp. b19]|uniref:ATP12 family protein n=1 Tax=Kiloniella sp. GXU_MW_B19 TaxID=3141326 RepID=UPI0031E3FAD5